MDALARPLLEKLLTAGQKAQVGQRSRAASLTVSQLSEYLTTSSLQRKESFETTMQAARAEGAVELLWDEEFIKRVNLVDARKLATFLGIRLTEDQVAEAREHLLPHAEGFPVILEVLERWEALKKVRGLGPESYRDWLDAVRVIGACRACEEGNAPPVREFSARLFKDSKRVEKLVGPLDVLLAGSIEGEIRDEAGVLQELGLFREEQPVRLAGNVVVTRERVTSVLDQPYSGFPAATVLRLASQPKLVMTIENLTTFHSMARQRCQEEILLIYTGGMPSPAWRHMYARLLRGLPTDVPVYHWGDVDEGGFRIAACIAREARTVGHALKPWKMHPEDIPESARRKASEHTLKRMRYFAQNSGWLEIGDAVLEAGFTMEQESLAETT